MTAVPQIHAAQRALERYGVALSLAQFREAERRLAAGDGVLLRHDRGSRIMLIRVGARVLPAVFAPDTGRIVTFLAPEHLNVVRNAAKGVYRDRRRASPAARRQGAAR